MLQMKPSNLLMACLLSAKASAMLIAPAHAAPSTAATEPVINSAIELDVINLKTNTTDRVNSDVVASQDSQDHDQNQDQNQDQDQQS